LKSVKVLFINTGNTRGFYSSKSS